MNQAPSPQVELFDQRLRDDATGSAHIQLAEAPFCGMIEEPLVTRYYPAPHHIKSLTPEHANTLVEESEVHFAVLRKHCGIAVPNVYPIVDTDDTGKTYIYSLVELVNGEPFTHIDEWNNGRATLAQQETLLNLAEGLLKSLLYLADIIGPEQSYMGPDSKPVLVDTDQHMHTLTQNGLLVSIDNVIEWVACVRVGDDRQDEIVNGLRTLYSKTVDSFR
jgi:hypothetical protein